MQTRKIILASSSPRRQQLLDQLGLAFEVDAGNGAEAEPSPQDPASDACRIALAKAYAAASFHPDAIILAADTFGILDGQILGKPRDDHHAVAMLQAMSGRCHTVITGFAILDTATGRTVSQAVETKVYFRVLSSAEIETYVKSGEPRDKAGAYAIQGLGAVLVEKIEGDYSNVIGLPLTALALALSGFGVVVLSS
jgi:septum formation protein